MKKEIREEIIELIRNELNKPLEVKYLDQFRYECNRLGFKFEIHNISIEDLYSNYRI